MSEHPKNRGGRPKAPEGSCRISLRVTSSQFAIIKRIAAETQRRQTDAARLLIRRGIDSLKSSS